MNWLMYIFGGYLVIFFYIGFCTRMRIKDLTDEKGPSFWSIISVLVVWIWICWRFIK